MTQIWYSLRLSEEDYQLVIRTLHELIQAPGLEEVTSGAMKMDRGQLQRLAEVWRTWLDLSSRQGDWITQAGRRCFNEDFEHKEGVDMYLNEIPAEHKKSASDWFANGILSLGKLSFTSCCAIVWRWIRSFPQAGSTTE